MATQTPNLSLKKPAGTDYVRIGDFNDNADKLDTTIGNPTQLQTAEKTNLVLAINEAALSGGENAPYIDATTKHWMKWDVATLQYVDTGVKAEGADGSDGADGISAFVWIKWSAIQPTQNSDMKDTPDQFIGVYSGTSPTAPTAYTSYQWYKYKGEKGDVGNPGTGNNWYVGTAISGTSLTPAVYPTGIPNALIGDMYLNNGELPDTGRAYVCTLGGNAATALWKYSCLLRGADGQGTGDMLKSIYDTNNSGVVDVAEKLPTYTTRESTLDTVGQWIKISDISLSGAWKGYIALLSIVSYGSHIEGNGVLEIKIRSGVTAETPDIKVLRWNYVAGRLQQTFSNFKLVYTPPLYEIWVNVSERFEKYDVTVLSQTRVNATPMTYYSDQPFQATQPAGTVVTASMLTLNNNTSGTAAGNIPLLPAATPTDLPLVSDANRGAQTKTAAEMRAILGAQATLTAGTDYATPEQVNGKQSKPAQLTALPASGTALTNNAEYRVSAAVGTYTFAWPDSPFECWLRFTTDATFSITFPAGTTYIGGAPTFTASKTYEMSVKDGVVIVQEVAAA